MATPWTQSLIISPPKKQPTTLPGLQIYQSHQLFEQRHAMQKGILNSFKPQAEEITAEEQSGFRVEWSITKQIFNLMGRLVVA